MNKDEQIMNDQYYDTGCTLTSLPASDLEHFKCLNFVAQTAYFNVTNGGNKHKNIYLSLLLYAQGKLGEASLNGNPKQANDCHFHQMQDIAHQVTILSHKPRNNSYLQSLKLKTSFKLHKTF
jgi:hypothetical protein